MNKAERQQWDDLAILYAEDLGKILKCSNDRGYHLHGGRDGCWAAVSDSVFRRLVAEGRINPDGTLKENTGKA